MALPFNLHIWPIAKPQTTFYNHVTKSRPRLPKFTTYA